MTPQETQPASHCIQFCQQEILCKPQTYSHDHLRQLLEMIFTDRTAYTGYLRFLQADNIQLFLFFFKGTPYAAGKYADGKPVIYSIQDLARQLVKTDASLMSVALCETDPVLLKCMLLFLEKEPAIKAPTSLIDFEYVVQQIGESGNHAMVALCRDNYINFYFFKNGICAQVYYSDPEFQRPTGLTLEEELLLYAFQPGEGETVQAYIYKDMSTSTADDSHQYDKDALYTLLTIGYLRNKRKSDQEAAPPAESPRTPAQSAPAQDAGVTRIILSIESGPLQGARFSVALPCTIGRKECDFILEDRLISRQHAKLERVDNEIVITDLESKNGTHVNGQKVTCHTLSQHDLISIGPINLKIVTE